MALSPAARQLYKRLLLAGRQYPGAGGLAEVRRRAKEAFRRPLEDGEAPRVAALQRGEHVVRELQALARLHKYRTLRRRYGVQGQEGRGGEP